MARQVNLKFRENEYEELEFMARSAGLKVPAYIRQKLKSALKEEARDGALVIRMIETMEKLQNHLYLTGGKQEMQGDGEVKKLAMFMSKMAKEIFSQVIIDKDKRKAFYEKFTAEELELFERGGD